MRLLSLRTALPVRHGAPACPSSDGHAGPTPRNSAPTPGTAALATAVGTATILLAGLLAGASFGPATALAQTSTPIATDEFSANAFRPAPGVENYLMLDGAQVDELTAPTFQLVFDYAHRSLVVPSECEVRDEISCGVVGSEVAIAENMVNVFATAAMTFGNRIQAALVIPFTWAEGDGLPYRMDGMPVTIQGGGSNAGVGDLRLEVKSLLLGGEAFGGGLAVVAAATAPVAQASMERRYAGESGMTVNGHLVGEIYKGPARLGVNLGGLWRSSDTLVSTRVGPMMTYGVGIDYGFLREFGVIAELTGASSFGLNDERMEVRAAARYSLGGFTFTGGGGFGLLRGVGVPLARVLVGASWAQRPDLDTDDDGIIDRLDDCPTDREDRDGVQDLDGCPDDDNDGDGFPDDQDQCPDEAEDVDEYEDEDGCPDLDNDGDSIPDGYDSCPNTPEDTDGDRDTDGCPDDDRDRDGVPDSEDQCPDEAEDTDGLADMDGCPEADFDEDGLLDEEDDCPEQPGLRSRQGCPARRNPPASAPPADPGATEPAVP